MTSPDREAPSWFPDWTGQACVIVASGPSAADVEIYEAKDKARVIAVNNSWQLAPWADALYACDHAWWKAHNGVPEFEGLKVSQDAKCAAEVGWKIRLVRCVRQVTPQIRMDVPGTIAWYGNSGMQAVNLALQFGAKKLILVGFDMTLAHGLHWHGKHGNKLNNPEPRQVKKWRDALDGAAKTFAGLGVSVFNISPISALTAYPKVTLSEALEV